jgi:hypothetical protein
MVAARWIARAAMLFGSVAIGVRFGVPPRAREAELGPDDDTTERLGRGNPAVPASVQARGAGHETQDMRAGIMTRLVVGLGVAAAVMVFVMVGMHTWLVGRQHRAEPRLTAEQRVHIKPPAPNLQADPPRQIAHLNAAEDQLLGQYAWVDSTHTRARIPIDRAMALTVGHSLDTAP